MDGPSTKALNTRPAVVVAKEPIHEQILPHIRRDIIEGRWAPGERLPEPRLCKEFGISRTPLRDALKILEAEGFVELVLHAGAVVTDPSAPDVAEKMEILAALERLAAEKVARARRPEALQTIRDLHARMRKAAAALDAETYYRLNDDFHRAIVTGTGNKSLMDMHERLMWHVHRARHRANDYERLSSGAAEHHDDIVRHILSGSGAAAARAMRDHLRMVSETILSQHGAEIRGNGKASRTAAPLNGAQADASMRSAAERRKPARTTGSRRRTRASVY